MRIDKLLANTGFGSRKEVKKLLKSGTVEADGEKLKNGATHVNPETQEITVRGETLHYQKFIYLMLNKPQGVVSATEDNLHNTVIDLLEFEDAVREPFPVGRLDKDTEGLLLLTNDGKFAHSLTSPNKKVPKVYQAELAKSITENDMRAFEEGILLDDGYQTKPAQLESLDQSGRHIQVTITEGKFHQVKRMFEARENKVLFLKRVKIGYLSLDPKLGKGEYRDLSQDELEKAKGHVEE
ncbi:pseudouridine synthase [Alteribacillus iranensis]|uniref:Pseudouridine synthase n=1 Tax=Alteribacillus iranensis TaxID=930128 RepID=A0A1I2ET20_9BACI|nr:pseudouridine synthase [Alteribacillus iranensis]SFE95370.1 ribosomal small subunit pseudouridine synthase A [Alteribacillus iranensis]